MIGECDSCGELKPIEKYGCDCGEFEYCHDCLDPETVPDA